MHFKKSSALLFISLTFVTAQNENSKQWNFLSQRTFNYLSDKINTGLGQATSHATHRTPETSKDANKFMVCFLNDPKPQPSEIQTQYLPSYIVNKSPTNIARDVLATGKPFKPSLPIPENKPTKQSFFNSSIDEIFSFVIPPKHKTSNPSLQVPKNLNQRFSKENKLITSKIIPERTTHAPSFDFGFDYVAPTASQLNTPEYSTPVRPSSDGSKGYLVEKATHGPEKYSQYSDPRIRDTKADKPTLFRAFQRSFFDRSSAPKNQNELQSPNLSPVDKTLPYPKHPTNSPAIEDTGTVGNKRKAYSYYNFHP